MESGRKPESYSILTVKLQMLIRGLIGLCGLGGGVIGRYGIRPSQELADIGFHIREIQLMGDHGKFQGGVGLVFPGPDHGKDFTVFEFFEIKSLAHPYSTEAAGYG